MYDVSTSTLWNSEHAKSIARRIAQLGNVYCGPAAVAWIAAVWNAHAGVTYNFMERLRDKKLFPDGPRSLSHRVPGFQLNMDALLQRETQGYLRLSSERYFTYKDIHRLIGSAEMPFIVRVPTSSIRHGLHYVTLFKSIATDTTFRCYWQDNGVFRSDEEMEEGISVSVRSLRRTPFFFWGARQVVKAER